MQVAGITVDQHHHPAATPGDIMQLCIARVDERFSCIRTICFAAIELVGDGLSHGARRQLIAAQIEEQEYQAMRDDLPNPGHSYLRRRSDSRLIRADSELKSAPPASSVKLCRLVDQ